MYVFAFDRDWTVDVNPHPRETAVPLEWVRYLAHETEHAVYAIGNQDLAAEAAIPGVVDIVGRHEDDWDDWLGAKQPDGRYERFPSRRERLSLVRDLHPGADAYVVVDDIDLRDVDDWTHYHAWEFVPAVERGDLDPTLPWVDSEPDASTDTEPDARTDGDGRPNAEAVADSEDETENDDSPGGNVASRDDDDSASASCAGGSRVRMSRTRMRPSWRTSSRRTRTLRGSNWRRLRASTARRRRRCSPTRRWTGTRCGGQRLPRSSGASPWTREWSRSASASMRSTRSP
jgi:hypothetical protein